MRCVLCLSSFVHIANGMQEVSSPYRKVVLVCVNERVGQEACAMYGAAEVHKAIKLAVREKDLTVRVSKSGCLDQCKNGPIVVIQPDNRWFFRVQMSDVEEIVSIACS